MPETVKENQMIGQKLEKSELLILNNTSNVVSNGVLFEIESKIDDNNEIPKNCQAGMSKATRQRTSKAAGKTITTPYWNSVAMFLVICLRYPAFHDPALAATVAVCQKVEKTLP
jgi:hypothetical protein